MVALDEEEWNGEKREEEGEARAEEGEEKAADWLQRLHKYQMSYAAVSSVGDVCEGLQG